MNKKTSDLVTFAPSCHFKTLAEDDENLERVNDEAAAGLDDSLDLTGGPIVAAVHSVSALVMTAAAVSPRGTRSIVITPSHSKKDENEIEAWD